MDVRYREPGLLKAGTELLPSKSPMSSSPKRRDLSE